MRKIFWILAIVASSCTTRKQLLSRQEVSHKSDSVIYIEHTRVDTIRWKADTVVKSIPIPVFNTDTVIVFKNGRAKTKLVNQSGMLEVTTTCDSLEKLVLSTQQRIREITKSDRNKVEQRIQTHQPFFRWGNFGGWAIAIVLTMLLVVGNRIK